MKSNEVRNIETSYSNPIRPAKLAHIVIRTSRYAESCSWWRMVLNVETVYSNKQLSFFTFDEEHHRLGIVNIPDLVEQNTCDSGVEHFAFTYNNLGELLANYLRLKNESIVPYWCINHGPTISMYYKDPDKNKIELQWDVFPDAADVQAFFDSGAYEENFMGIMFDPEKMVVDFESGRPMEEIVSRPKLPAGKTPWDMHIS